jgi:energy-coupling factor transporter ATP-binding protein EcfA2
MIKLFHAENFGCLKNVEFELTPLHAFIGPNDSGKSTLLSALSAFGQLNSGDGDPYIGYLPNEGFATLQILGTDGAVANLQGNQRSRALGGGKATGFMATHPGWKAINEKLSSAFLKELGGARMARFDADALRQPSPLLPLENAEAFFSQRGTGLPGLLGSIYLRGEEGAISDIRQAVQTLFPTIQRIGTVSVGTSQVQLEAVLCDGTKVRAPEMSEGLLYFLAFFVLQYLERVTILLIEEPENGLHPSRVMDVIRVLRSLTETKALQVIMSTHSPLVINELKPEEVSIVTRPNAEQGTVVTPMTKTPNFEARSKVLNLGELWLSYANGKDEADLLNEPAGLSSKSEG